MSRPITPDSGPCMRKVMVIFEPGPSGSTRWSPTVVIPPFLVSQTKARSGSISVTRQRADGRLGCFRIASLPGGGPLVQPHGTERVLAESSGQRSMSMNNPYTTAGGTLTVADTRCSMRPSLGAGSPGPTGPRYQATGPSRSTNRPVPADASSVARATIASVPSVTV